MERRRLTLNNVSAVALNSRCNQLLQASSRKLQYIQSQATVQPVESYSSVYIQTRATVLFNQSRMYSKRCHLDKLKRRRLNNHSLVNPDASYSDPVARTSRPTTGVPVASTDFQMVSLPPASAQPVASTSSQLLQ
ncbi:hypothetical protein F511_44519 [Dorcoceras hygrometricum]|uniref:Uncharacterized protein n=1 Tax=Dorcoceras hygrometricum TaxID=472368 RepID=A0A2Z7ALB7_9LAMI|nr:hypothetical protein F511_44519 [Dorcoceras hygrometricum]